MTAQDQRICIPVDYKVYSSWQKKLIKKNILVVRLFILISHSNKKAVRCPKTFSQDQRQLALYYNRFSYWIHTASVVFALKLHLQLISSHFLHCFHILHAKSLHVSVKVMTHIISLENEKYCKFF